MKREMKKVLVFGLIGIFVFSLGLNFVSAASLGESLSNATSWVWEAGKSGLVYIFGEVPDQLVSEYGSTSASIVIFCIWGLIFITFADVISTFSSFGKGTSIIVAFFVAVIAANTKMIGNGVVAMTQWFVWGGTFAVYLALGGAFLAFFAVNLGINKLGTWIMKRKAMMHAQKSKIETEAGGIEVEGAIDAMKGVGKSLRGKV